MKDRFGREIDYLRISVIDTCNLRCVYCMPVRGLRFVPSDQLLTAAEIERVARAATRAGFRRIRLTGGEPTLRTDIVDVVRRVAAVPGIAEVAMTTNAILLPRLAPSLAEAGLRRINIHVDTLDPDRLRRIMRFGTLAEIEEGIVAAEAAGLTPLKINCVVARGYNEGDVVDMARRTLEKSWHVRFIELMPLGTGEAAHVALSQFVPSRETRERIEAALGPLAPLPNANASDESRNFRLEGARGVVGLHQPRQRALLRHLQPHAPHRRRPLPPLPAARRRAGREERAARGRLRRGRGRGAGARGGPRSRPATTSTKASPPSSARCSRSGAEASAPVRCGWRLPRCWPRPWRQWS